MRFPATIKFVCVLAGIAILFNGIEAKRCPSGCKYGTTTVMQRIRKDCTKLFLFRWKCTKVVPVCVCATSPPTTTTTTMATTSTQTDKPTTRRNIMTTKPTATRKTMLVMTSKVGSKKTSNSDVLYAICKNRSEDKFHFPHPTDASKFVQCDAYGRAFVMSCFPSMVWNDDIKACDRKRSF